MENSVGLGGRIKILRGTASAAEFAAKTGVSRNTLVAYESGTSTPDASYLLKVLSICPEATAAWLLTGDEERPKINSSLLGNLIEIIDQKCTDLGPAEKGEVIAEYYLYLSKSKSAVSKEDVTNLIELTLSLAAARGLKGKAGLI